MKPKLRKVLLVGAPLLLLIAVAHSEPIRPDAVTNLEITTPLNTASEDNYLLDLARTAKVNFIVDASDFPPPSPIKGYPATSGSIAGVKKRSKEHWVPRFINVMGDFMAQEKLSVLRPDAHTFLFWSEPDARQLLAAQLAVTRADSETRFAEAVAAARAEGVPEDKIIKGAVSDDQRAQILSDYLKNEQGWSGTAAERNVPVDIRARFDDLPPALRALLLLDMRGALSGVSEISSREKETEYLHTEKEGEATKLKITFQNVKTGRISGYSQVFATFSEPDAAAETPPLPAQSPPVTAPQEPPASIELTAEDTLFRVYSDIADSISNPTLDADVTLAKPVALDTKRLPLRDLIAQLVQQTGVQLVLANDAPASKLVTAHVADMPLAKFMGILSRMYGVKWRQGAGNSYTLHGNDQGELHLALLKIGDPEWYRLRFQLYNRVEREMESAAVAKAIVQQVGLEALQKPEGVAVSTLPQPLQQRFINVEREPYLDSAPKMLYQTNQLLAQHLAKKDLVLRFGNTICKQYHTPVMGFDYQEEPGHICFNVQSEDGHIIMPAFDPFDFYVPTQAELTARPPSRRR